MEFPPQVLLWLCFRAPSSSPPERGCVISCHMIIIQINQSTRHHVISTRFNCSYCTASKPRGACIRVCVGIPTWDDRKKNENTRTSRLSWSEWVCATWMGVRVSRPPVVDDDYYYYHHHRGAHTAHIVVRYLNQDTCTIIIYEENRYQDVSRYEDMKI